MDRFSAPPRVLAAIGILALLAGSSVIAQSTLVRRALIDRINDEAQLITLAGNTRPEMTPANDRGPVADDVVLEMYIQLNRAPELQLAMDDLVNQLHDPKSARFHRWLSADEIATQFGPAEEDIQAVKTWLESHGFTVNVIYRANGVLDVSGPASAIRETFHTEIHNLSVHGKSYIANATDPKIPAALAAAINGVVSLNNFRPRAMSRSRPLDTFPAYGGTEYALVPDDLYTIYNFYPIYAAGITGRGQTIAVVEDSDLYATSDWYTFRTTFGLAQRFPHGSLTQIHPQPSHSLTNLAACADPGANGDDFETEIDAEWATAAAPDAAIVAASCADNDFNFNAGMLVALQNMLTGEGTVPAIISDSYGTSETENGPSLNAYILGLYEIAVLQGSSGNGLR